MQRPVTIPLYGDTGPGRAVTLAAGLALFALLATAGPAAGQQTPMSFTDTWEVTWDMGLRTDGDRVIEVTRRGGARLVLEQHGDSVTGTWTALVGDRTPVVVAGTAHGDTLRLAAPDAAIRDGRREIPVSFRWHGVLEDDAITGTLWIVFPGGDAPPRRWEAVRR